MRTRTRLALAGLAGVLCAAGVVMLPAGAASATKYGWWSELDSGTGIPAPVPPQVPKGGLYVENGYSGPVDISALTFSVPAGAAVGSVTLHVAGTPVLTKPPVACPIAQTSIDYQAAEDGAWSKRPAYQCSVASVTGVVASGNSSVSFDAGPLLRYGSVAMVVLAGGPADSIAFDAPGPDALQMTPAGSPTLPAASPAPFVPAPAPPSAQGATSGPVATPVASGLTPAVGAISAPAASTRAGAGSAGPPAIAPPLPAASRPAQQVPAVAIRHSGAWRKDVAGWLGLAALLVALVAWSEGFGLLGGRIRRPAVPAANSRG